jgi:hypothetical protein
MNKSKDSNKMKGFYFVPLCFKKLIFHGFKSTATNQTY